jgi:hypothetical protein
MLSALSSVQAQPKSLLRLREIVAWITKTYDLDRRKYVKPSQSCMLSSCELNSLQRRVLHHENYGV